MPALGQGAGKSAAAERRIRRRRPARGTRPSTAGNANVGRTYRPRPQRRPTMPGVAFRPISSQSKAFKPQLARADVKVRHARRRLPDHPAIPHVPVIGAQNRSSRQVPIPLAIKALEQASSHYSTKQIQQIHDLYRKGARRAGVDTIHELFMLGSNRQRKNMVEVGRAIAATRFASDVAARNARDTVRAAPRRSGTQRLIATATGELAARAAIPGVQQATGQSKSIFDLGRTALRYGVEAPASTIFNLGRATVESPGAVAKSSLRTGVESIAGIPEAVKVTIDQVEKHGLVKGAGITLGAMAKDYERRYGPILSDPAKFREQVKKDYGLTPFVFDAASVGASTGRLAGALARSGPAGRAAAALTHIADKHPNVVARGASGAARGVRRAAAGERPNLRFSAGEGGVRSQQRSKNLFVGLGQSGIDRARSRAFDRRVRDAGLERAPDGRIIEPETGGGRLPGLRPGAGEVLPKTTGVVGRSVRELPGLRSMTGRVARDIGGEQSVTRLRMLTTRGRILSRMNRTIGRLSGDEQRALKYMLQLGVKPDEAGLRALQRRLAQMTRGRERQGMERVTPILADTNDEVRLLREILSEPTRFLTPEARAAADELRGIQLDAASRDPDLPPERELVARLNPQADLLGIQRAPDVDYFRSVLTRLEEKTGVPGLAARADELASLAPEERAAVAKQLLKAARKDRKGAERALASIEVEASRLRERLRTREHYAKPDAPPDTAWFRPRPDARNPPAGRGFIDDQGQLHTWAEGDATHTQMEASRGVRSEASLLIRPDGTVVYTGGRLPEGDALAAAVEQDPRLNAPGVGAPRTPGIFNADQLRAARERAETVVLERAAARRTLQGAQDAEKALKKVVKVSKSPKHMRLEGAENFAMKVRAAAEEAGLAEPAYWESAMRPPGSTAALAATGRGLRATNRSKRRTGAIFEVGAEETSPDVFTRGVERNIKRRFQWALVQRNLETHSFEWSRGPSRGGITAKDVMREMDERRIDPDSVELINANFVHRRPVDEAAAARGDTVLQGEELGDQITSTGNAQAELAAARRRVADVQAEAQAGQAMNRYFVVPKDVADTTAATLRATDNTAWRALEIILKQKPARILLGALNVPWLSFQIASNALLTGFGGGVNPFNIHGAHKWFRSLEPDERAAVEAELGITHGHHMIGQDEPNLGATNLRMVNFWRAYKKSRVGRLGTRVNPLNLMFRADEAQNNFFRRTLFYDAARKNAYRRMGASWKANDRLMSRLMDRVLAKPPGELGPLIARHSEDFERVAKHTNDFLGDYLRYSPAERFLLSRNVMFYGYLRFSLRFTFYTMPVKHPVMTALMSNLGRLGAQEIKDLFGVPSNYQLPNSMLSQVYFGDRSDAQAGRLRSLPLGRFNPFLNTVTQLDGMQQAVGLVSPIYQALVDQAFEESTFTGRDWRIEGRPTPSEAERPKDYYGSAWSMFQPSIPGVSQGSPRGRILERQLLNLAFPYRTAEQVSLAPNQSDDALLWQPHPMTYADPTAAAGVQHSRDVAAQQGILGRVGARAFPVQPQITAAPAVVQREREKEAAAAERATRKPGERKRRKRKTPLPNYGGGGGSTANNYGGGGTSSFASRYGG